MKCEWCGNTSGFKDGRGGCASCGGFSGQKYPWLLKGDEWELCDESDGSLSFCSTTCVMNEAILVMNYA